VGTQERAEQREKSRSDSGRGAANGQGSGGPCQDGPARIPAVTANGANDRAAGRRGFGGECGSGCHVGQSDMEWFWHKQIRSGS
jgi:hypothetical protein